MEIDTKDESSSEEEPAIRSKAAKRKARNRLNRTARRAAAEQANEAGTPELEESGDEQERKVIVNSFLEEGFC